LKAQRWEPQMTKQPPIEIESDPLLLPLTMSLQERAAIRRKQFEEKQRAASHVAFLKAYDRALHKISPMAEQRDPVAEIIRKLRHSTDAAARSAARDLLTMFRKDPRGRPRADRTLFEIAYVVHTEIAARRQDNPDRMVQLKDVYASVAERLRLEVGKVARAYRKYRWWFEEADEAHHQRNQAKSDFNK
jgi:hypothetical protein